MGLVNSLKFDYNSGAIITDEEYFIGGRRRVHTADNMQSLISEEISNELEMEVIYGGAGNISITNQIVAEIKNELQKRFDTYKKKGKEGEIFKTVEDVSRIALKIFQNDSRKYVNRKLSGLFGFSIDDFNRGFYFRNGSKIEIKDDKIITKAMEIIMLKSDNMKDINELEGLITGTDRHYGFNAFDFYGGMTHLYISTSLYNAIGAGSTTTSLAFGELINNLTLDERRNGIDRVFGLVELIRITNQTAIKNSEVGGYYNIIYLNGNGKNRSERLIEVTGDLSQYLKETVTAYDNNLIPKEVCYSVIENYVFEKKDFNLDEAEPYIFNNASDTDKLQLLLRGYKI